MAAPLLPTMKPVSARIDDIRWENQVKREVLEGQKDSQTLCYTLVIVEAKSDSKKLTSGVH